MSSVRDCPVCSSARRIFIYEQKFYEGVLGHCRNIVVCEACGAGYSQEVPSQPELNHYYAEQAKYAFSDGVGTNLFEEARFERIADQISATVSLSARILDVGCALGGLLYTLRERGYKNIAGLDPSADCVRSGERRGLTIRKGTIDSLSESTELYDCILMIGVLEHIRDVNLALEVLVNHLSPGGLLLIAVPDVEGFSRCWNAPFQQFSMEHVNFFSALSLCNLLARHSFVQSDVRQYTVEWSEGIAEPILSIAFQRGANGLTCRDTTTEVCLNRYIDWSREADVSISNLISRLAEAATPIWIWGTGALTRRLMSETRLRQCNVVGFIDTKRDKTNTSLDGVKIYLPEEVVHSTEAILICSIAFQREIEFKVREIGLKNQLIALHPEFPLSNEKDYTR